MKQLNDKANIAVKRVQSRTNGLTAADVRNSDFMDNIVKKDEGYYIFKHLRNSPAYLEKERQIVARYARRLTPSCKAGACTGQNSSMKNNKGH